MTVELTFEKIYQGVRAFQEFFKKLLYSQLIESQFQ